MHQTRVPAKYRDRVALSRGEVAATLGKSEDFVDALVTDGLLHSVKLRGSVFIVAHSLWLLLEVEESNTEPYVSAKVDSLLTRLGV